MMSHVLLEPEIADGSTANGRWMVLIYDNDTNTMDEVVDVLMRATGCDAEEAAIEMWEAHTYGKAPVHFASKSECDDVAAIIASIGVKTEVTREWED
jgi:ATP-dependent Clp protease adapter protein ClpS